MPVIQVFEHSRLRVGDSGLEPRHLAALERLEAAAGPRYFSLTGREEVRFHQYVGVLQAADLTLEILPKADAAEAPDRRRWQRLLIELLAYCRLLKVHRLSEAPQGWRQQPLLDYFVDHFLEEMADLLRQGLVRSYRRHRENREELRGRLLLGPHLQRNAARPDRFFTEYGTYDYQHLFNAILWQALQVLSRLLLSPDRTDRLRQLLAHFPGPAPELAAVPPWELLAFDRRTARYRPALRLAWLICRHALPDLRAGRRPALALLFDMNSLFEEYVYRQLRHPGIETLTVQRQVRRPFWEQSHLRPDLLLRDGNRQVVLDTKWKVLLRPQPAAADLHQLFVYQQYFQAAHGALVYPRAGALHNTPPSPFHPARQGDPLYTCQLLFVDVADERGGLNRNLGKMLVDVIRQTADGRGQTV